MELAQTAPPSGTLSVNAVPSEETRPHPLSDYLPYERLAEGGALLLIAVLGLFLNLIILVIMLCFKDLRKFINGFTAHACLLDAFKSSLAVPYALSLLNILTPVAGCNALGLTYIMALTVSTFNLLAMILSDAYIFYEKNVGEAEDSRGGAFTCLLFSVLTIYIGSVILHLGPTLIGGEFKHNADVGNCTFAYGKVQNYIVHVIWIAMMTLTLIVISQYTYKFNRQLNANQRYRITNLARNAVAYSKGEDPDEAIYQTVRRLKRRVRVFGCLTLLYFVTWYPLFILTLVDYKYEKPRYLYRILTVLAWSHSALVPLTHLLVDQSYSIRLRLRGRPDRRARADRRHKQGSTASQQALTISSVSSANNSVRTDRHQTVHGYIPSANNGSPWHRISAPHQTPRQTPRHAPHCAPVKEKFSIYAEVERERLSSFEEEADALPAAELNRLLADQRYEEHTV